MGNYPEYVERAFSSIRVISTEEWIQEDIAAFTQRWSGIDLLTFARVLHQAHGDDQMVAAFALGYTRSAWARDLLLDLAPVTRKAWSSKEITVPAARLWCMSRELAYVAHQARFEHGEKR